METESIVPAQVEDSQNPAVQFREKRLAAHSMKNYLAQSGLAALFILAVYLTMHTAWEDMVLASLGATTFLVFSSPHKKISHPKILLGGYSIGILSGILSGTMMKLALQYLPFPMAPTILVGSIAVFMAMFTMVYLNLKHASACAIAVSIAIAEHPFYLAVYSFCAVCVLCIIRRIMSKKLVDF